MSRRAEVDRIWQLLVTLVMESRGDWRRAAIEVTGLPFSRVRALTRVANGPLSLRELAEAMTIDAPAATVIVNDLEERGLVRRRSHATDRRTKVVSVTAAGKRLADAVSRIDERAPEPLASLSAKDVATLSRIFTPRE
ncbi:MAG TPA: MarR family transcriptional regulator [Myxococcales bacterium]|jgi:DNA-binding MarR family transcriptional regulator|nr:MarR family transcriptional regulator [Myxococcales bacterium]